MTLSYTSLPKICVWALALVFVLSSCSSGGFSDIDQYMADVKAKPVGVIEPIPVFKPYQVFRYNAAATRSPFEVPVKVREITSLARKSNVKPDLNRTKEQLESFNIESLAMVGTLSQAGQTWALIEDTAGSVHQVLTGNYMGRNHGRIVEVGNDSIAVIEIISNGKDSWIERPRTLKLKDGS
jgi:type IV pilus assembly protein PilP